MLVLEPTSRRSLLKFGASSVLAVGGAAATLTASAQAPKSSPRMKAPSIDEALAAGVRRGDVAGVVGLAADKTGLVYEGAFGRRDLTRSTAMSVDTVFWLLSMTKAITATACMQLVEQGKLRLDQPIGEIAPEFAKPQVLEGFDASGRPQLRPARRAVTLRHLLTHTSGYTYANWSDRLGPYEQATGQPDVAYSKTGSLAAPLEFDPGERWQYGIGMDVAGRLVEAVTDQSLEIYFREHIFQPLGMHNTGFLISTAQREKTATTYSRQSDGSLSPMPFEMSQRPEFFSGGGGLFGTPRDYIAFLQMLLREGRFNGARILKPETVRLMRTNQIGDLNVQPLKSSAPAWSRDADLFPGMPQKWGLSFDINTQPGPNGRAAGSLAWAGLLNCYFWIDPARGVTGALFSQLLPFYDERAVALFGAFERGVYASLARG